MCPDKEYVRIALTNGLTNNYQAFVTACEEQGIDALPRNKFIDLEFDLLVAQRDYPEICPYISYLRKKHMLPSTGLGDTLAKVFSATGITKATELFTRATGVDCNCHGRQAWLNNLVPYGGEK